jgi:galactokinase
VPADGSADPRTVDPPWGCFVAGVLTTLAALGAEVPALDVEIASTVPVGSGLSSSSALAVALTLACSDAAGARPLDRRELPRAAWSRPPACPAA